MLFKFKIKLNKNKEIYKLSQDKFRDTTSLGYVNKNLKKQLEGPL